MKTVAQGKGDNDPSTSKERSNEDPPNSKDVSNTERMLLAEESLTRSSPELWPETGVTEFLARSTSPLATSDSAFNSEKQISEWMEEYNEEDINMLHGYGSLTAIALLDKVKEIEDLAYQLGLEEEREMTRAKFLNILTQN